MVTSLVSSAVCESACGCGGTKNASVSPEPVQVSEKRDSPPRNLQYEYDMDMSMEGTPERPKETKRRERNEMMKYSHLPSGLSVEVDEPEMERTSYY